MFEQNEELLFLRQACQHAAEASSDPHTQNGAVLVALNGQVVVAANTLPDIVFKEERLVRPQKYSYIEHAERNVIYTAAKRGICTARATLYCPWFACTDCARAIIQAGIQRVVGHLTPYMKTPERWRESVQRADEMLDEAGVIRAYKDDELNVSFLFDGELLEL